MRSKMASPFTLCAVALGLSFQAPSAQVWSEEGTWAFAPGPDSFSSTALLDLRSLNEKVAGESGFVKVSPEGDFLTGNGKPLRVWAVNTGVGREKPFVKRPLGRQTEPNLDRHARFLAKRGVNMVRYHGQISPDPENPQAKLTDVNEKEVDWAWRLVASMKKEGIYVCLSPYWGVPFKVRPEWGVTGGAHENALALLFFEPKMKAAYKEWMRKLLTRPNPYTGIPLAKDPALAIIQIQNEDSLFFWTLNSLKGEAKAMLGRQFGDWLKKKHGSLAAAAKNWDNNVQPGDALSQGVVDIVNLWELTQDREGGFARRLNEQTQFLAELQHGFNKEMVDFFRKDLGCGQIVNANNWKTASTVRLMDVERWTYTAGEVDAVNHYMDGIHMGPNQGWAIVPGDKFTSPSVLDRPALLPINLKQTKGRPMMVTESSWVMPHAYAAEGPFLISAYQGLTGVDAFFWFATGDDEWTPPQSANGYMPSQSKWVHGTPEMLGGFPAAALMHRMGMVKRGSPILDERRSLTDLWERRTPLLAEEASFDPNRDAGNVAPRSSVKTALSPEAFLAGPVTVTLGGDPAETKAASLSTLINKGEGSIRSVTGELEIASSLRAATINTPMAQGVAAFFGRRASHRLADVTFSSQNEYGAALAVSMDGQPLKSSKKVLVQFTTRSRPAGWRERNAEFTPEGGSPTRGMEVVSFGQAPWRVQEAKLTVMIANPGLKKATELSPNGDGVRPVTLEAQTGGVRFTFPSKTLYVVLEG
jgi:hypothetical protein